MTARSWVSKAERSSGGLLVGTSSVDTWHPPHYAEASAGGLKAGNTSDDSFTQAVNDEASAGGLLAGSTSDDSYTTTSGLAVRQQASASGTGTTVTLTWPETTLAGSCLVIAVAIPITGEPTDIDTPAGWTAAETGFTVGAAMSVYYLLGAGAQASQAVTLATSYDWVCQGFELLGVSTGEDQVYGFATSAPTAPTSGPTGTLASASEIAVLFSAVNDPAGTVSSWTGSWSYLAEVGVDGDLGMNQAAYTTSSTAAISTTGTGPSDNYFTVIVTFY